MILREKLLSLKTEILIIFYPKPHRHHQVFSLGYLTNLHCRQTLFVLFILLFSVFLFDTFKVNVNVKYPNLCSNMNRKIALKIQVKLNVMLLGNKSNNSSQFWSPIEKEREKSKQVKQQHLRESC